MKNLLIETSEHCFEVECADNVNLDGAFAATCLETGEQLTIYGWNCDITDLTDVNLGGWSARGEMQAEARALGVER